MKSTVLLLAAVFLVLVENGKVIAGVVYATGNYYLYSTGVGADGSNDPAHSAISADISIQVVGSGADKVTSSAFAAPLGATLTSSVNYEVNYGKIGLQVEGHVIGDNGLAYAPSAGGVGNISWTDAVSLVWRGPGLPAAIPGTHLDFILQPEGALNATLGPFPPGQNQYYGSGTGSNATISLQAGLVSKSYTVSKNAVYGGTPESSITAFPTITAAYSIGPGGRTAFSYGIGVSVGTTLGDAVANFLHTLAPIAITFDNGQTPENLGYDLMFDSGMQSPNAPAAVVPEPSSFILFGFGAMFIATCDWRRRAFALWHQVKL